MRMRGQRDTRVNFGRALREDLCMNDKSPTLTGDRAVCAHKNEEIRMERGCAIEQLARGISFTGNVDHERDPRNNPVRYSVEG